MIVPGSTVLVSGLVLGVGTYLIRLAGPLLRSRVALSPAAEALMSRAAVVLLAALAVTSAVLDGHHPAGWARPLAVLVAAVLAWRGAPFAVVFVVAAVTAAGLRLIGLA